jgi:hypothetical protein
MPAGFLASVIVTEFQATEVYSSLDLTKEKYNISRLSVVERKYVIIRISPNNLIAYEKKKINMMMETKFTFSMYTQSLNIIFSQYKSVSKSM